MTVRHIIAETENVTAILQEAQGEAVVVTFNELGTTHNGDRFWGDSFLRKIGVPSVGFVTKRPNWYPRDEMAVILPLVVEAIGNRRVITYGHSQGGYGALKFSKTLGADTVLAFCPQWSINPSDVGHFDRRFIQHYDEALANGEKIVAADLAGDAYLFYDSREGGDRENANKISALGKTRSIVSPFSGHATVRLFSESGVAAELIECCVQRQLNPRVLRRLVRKTRRSSKTYSINLSDRLLTRYLASKAETPPRLFLHQAFDRAPDHNRIGRAILLHKAGNVENANSLIQELTHEEIYNFGLMRAWQLFRTQSFKQGELLTAKAIVAATPDDTFMCLHSVNSYLSLNMRSDAEAELVRLSKHPRVYDYEHYINFAAELGCFDLISDALQNINTKVSRVKLIMDILRRVSHLPERQTKYRVLMQMREHAGEDDQVMRAFSDQLFRIGESGFALEYRHQLMKKAPSDPKAVLAVIECIAQREDGKARELLSKAVSELRFDSSDWEKISEIRQTIQMPEEALRAAQMALQLDQSNASARLKVARLLRHFKSRGKARSVLKETVLGVQTEAGVAVELSREATAIGHPEIAAKILADYLKVQPKNTFVAKELTDCEFLVEDERNTKGWLERVGLMPSWRAA